jgi:hypothetical protein
MSEAFRRLQLVERGTDLRPPLSSFDGGRGGGDDGGMEARVAKLEAAVEHIQVVVGEIKADLREVRRDMRGDFRLLFGAVIFVALGLAGLMAKGFGWL